MSYIIRIFLVFFFTCSTLYAEPLELKFNGKKIELPYWSATKQPHGAVILIHGGQQAKWSMLLANLAQEFSKNGWSSVLLNCNQDNPEPWIKEFPEVISVLRQQNLKRIIVLHYGDQVKQTMDSFNKVTNSGVQGIILLSAYNLDKAVLANPELSMPLFDIAAQFDYELILEQLNNREKAFAQKKYLAMRVPGAHHDYEYSKDLLLSFMHGWMLRLAEFKPEPPPVSYIASIEPLMPKEIAFDADGDWMEVVASSTVPSDDEAQEIIPP